MNQGDIATIPIITSSGVPKNRPVLLLKQMPPFGDWLVCGISGQLHQEVKGFDVVVLDNDPDFAATGLRNSSVIRLGYLAVVPKKDIPGIIDAIDSGTLKLLLQRLVDHLSK
jgi:mRNA interferase MazF